LDPDPDPNPLVRGTDPGICIRIRTKMSRIRNTGRSPLLLLLGQEVYEVRRTGYRRVQEFWEPKLEELDTLLVTRQIPTLHILLSKVPVSSTWTCFSWIQIFCLILIRIQAEVFVTKIERKKLLNYTMLRYLFICSKTFVKDLYDLGETPSPSKKTSSTSQND
jgi:hypothetical protein